MKLLLKRLRRARAITQPLTRGGFTIVELMIATLVFSVILLVITSGVMHFTNAYYKGVNSSATQDTVRNIIGSVSQAIQFGGNSFGSANLSVSGGTYCIGNQQFDFVLGKEMGSATTRGLYVSPHSGSGCSSLSPMAIVSGGQELLGPRMRLSAFQITQTASNAYNLTVRVAYGDDDLLVNPTSASPHCIAQTGSQFCVVSGLATTVESRINGLGE